MKWGAMKGIGIARIGLVAAGLTAAALTTGAQAQEGELVKNLLSNLGVIADDKPPIEYRERPPLVLPPRMDLREPVQAGAAQARNPQWPNDPDVVARRRRAAEERTPVTETDQSRMNGNNSRLSIEEMRAGRRAGAGVPAAPVASKSESQWIHPDVLRAQERQVSASQVQLGGEPGTRRSLTEPPSAYRQSATGAPIRGSFQVEERVDEADPRVFQREQQRR
jgi:hypothetical protein